MACVCFPYDSELEVNLNHRDFQFFLPNVLQHKGWIHGAGAAYGLA